MQLRSSFKIERKFKEKNRIQKKPTLIYFDVPGRLFVDSASKLLL